MIAAPRANRHLLPLGMSGTSSSDIHMKSHAYEHVGVNCTDKSPKRSSLCPEILTGGFSRIELTRIETIVRNNQTALMEVWDEYFGEAD